MYFRRKTSAGRAYLQIVESRRDGDQVRQQVIATLGRYEELQESGQLERLLRSGARFAGKAMVLSAIADDSAMKIASRRIGPAMESRMMATAQRLIAPYRGSLYRIGYFSDNEVGWWAGALFIFYSSKPAGSVTKQRWVELLRRHYSGDWSRFTADFLPPAAEQDQEPQNSAVFVIPARVPDRNQLGVGQDAIARRRISGLARADDRV